jgi:hypothetical protein
MEVQLGLLTEGTKFTYNSIDYRKDGGRTWVASGARKNNEVFFGPQDNESDTIIKVSPYLGGKFQDNPFVQIWFNTKTIVTVYT